MNNLEFKMMTRSELLPFMRETFKQSLDSGLVCELDDIIGENEKYQKLRSDCLKQQSRLDLGLFINEELIGSFMGRHVEKGIFRMGTSVILPEYQGRGFYRQLLDYVIQWAEQEGYWAIESNHNPCNTKIITIKLKKGFYITGSKTTLHTGSILTMTKFLKPEHEELFKFRNGFAAPTDFAKNLFNGLRQ